MSEENTIHPTAILTNCRLGTDISVGPFCHISDTTLEDHVFIEGSAWIEKSTIGTGSTILWGSIIRESLLSERCVIGCEVKKSHLGKHNKAKHSGTSIISTTSGERVNFGGGFKCANYDGTGKGHFVIGDDVFLGCNSVISVCADATTTLHENVKIGANTHISQDIPPNSLVYIDRSTGALTVREGYLSH